MANQGDGQHLTGFVMFYIEEKVNSNYVFNPLVFLHMKYSKLAEV